MASSPSNSSETEFSDDKISLWIMKVPLVPETVGIAAGMIRVRLHVHMKFVEDEDEEDDDKENACYDMFHDIGYYNSIEPSACASTILNDIIPHLPGATESLKDALCEALWVDQDDICSFTERAIRSSFGGGDVSKALELMVSGVVRTDWLEDVPPLILEKIDWKTYRDVLREGEPQECSICLKLIEEYQIVGKLPCFHVFHNHCIMQWLRHSNRCPYCRHNVVQVS